MKLGLGTRIGSYVALAIVSLFSMFPLYWMVASSVRPRNVLLTTPPPYFTTDFDASAYVNIWTNTPFGQMFINSLFISIVTTIVTVVFSAMAGHSLARLKFRGKTVISRGVLITYLFPQILLVVPLFVAMVNLGLVDTYFGLILTYMTFSFPFGMWMLTAYFQTIPVDLEEAALLDGASRLTIFLKIVLPLSRPGLAAVGIFTFIHAWNEFLYALVLLNSDEKLTLSIGLYRMLDSETVDWGEILAATSMIVAPVLVVFMFFERHLVGGLTAGATKG